MKTALSLLAALGLAACGDGSDELPAPPELYGTWLSLSVPGEVHGFEFRGSDAYDLYTYSKGGIVEHEGAYRILDLARADEQPQGALMLDVTSGPRAGREDGTYILGWTGDTLTLWHEFAPRQEQVFERQRPLRDR